MTEKTVTIDQGSFFGKKDFTLGAFIKRWENWATDVGLLCEKTKDFDKFYEFQRWTKKLAAENWEKMYEKQYLEMWKKLKEKDANQ